MKDERLIVTAAEVAGAAPREWRAFLEAFKEFSEARATDCVRSDRASLQVTQGRAQLSASLLALFAEAPQKRDRLSQKGRGQ